MNIPHYILNERGEPVAEPDLMKWGEWMENEITITHRIVRIQYVGEARISTVFLGINARILSPGPPVLWETYVSGGLLDELTNRCAGNRDQAQAMHENMVKRVQLATIGICDE